MSNKQTKNSKLKTLPLSETVEVYLENRIQIKPVQSDRGENKVLLRVTTGNVEHLIGKTVSQHIEQSYYVYGLQHTYRNKSDCS